jgi:CRP-like cAMP-binding protein
VSDLRTIEDLLAEHPFCAGMKPEHLHLLAGCGKNVHLPAGKHALRTGEPADTFYALREGVVALEVYSPTGGGLVVQTLHAGEILGWSWLFPPYRWTFDARVVEPVRAIALDGACLRGKAEADHELGYELMKRVAKVFTTRLAATRMQLLDLYGARD